MDRKTRDRLIEIIEGESRSPGSHPDVLKELEDAFPEQGPLLRFLLAKDDQHRHAFYLKSQHVWYRKLGWRIMRPLFIVAVIAAVLFSLQRVIDPAIGVACFIAGAAALYVTLQIFAHRWSYKELARMGEVDERYRKSLESLLDELRRMKR